MQIAISLSHLVRPLQANGAERGKGKKKEGKKKKRAKGKGNGSVLAGKTIRKIWLIRFQRFPSCDNDRALCLRRSNGEIMIRMHNLVACKIYIYIYFDPPAYSAARRSVIKPPGHERNCRGINELILEDENWLKLWRVVVGFFVQDWNVGLFENIYQFLKEERRSWDERLILNALCEN